MNGSERMWTIAALVVAGGVTGALDVSAQPEGSGLIRVGLVITESDSLEGRLLDPNVCPWNPDLIAFQAKRSRDRLYVVDQRDGTLTEVISTTGNGGPFDAPGGTFEGELDWLPVPDVEGRAWFAFSGAGDFNNRDIYLSYLGAGAAYRLTDNRAIDGNPRFSPDGKSLMFVSTRSGEGDLFLIGGVDDLRAAIDSGEEIRPEDDVVRLTDNPRPDLHPAWHPLGRFVVYSQFARAEEELTTEANYGLAVLDTSKRGASPTRLTFDRAQETRASWSPDGNRLAFYFSERVEATSVSVGVLEVIYEAESDVPVRARLIETGAGRALADDVLPSDRNGPVWIPDPLVPGRGHSLVYLDRRSTDDAYGVVVSDVRRWESGDAGHGVELRSSDVSVVSDPVWDHRSSILCAGQTGLSFGLFRMILARELFAGGDPFPRSTIRAPKRGRSILGPPYWEEAAAAVGIGVVAFILASGGDDPTDPVGPPGSIGTPPDPPGGR